LVQEIGALNPEKKTVAHPVSQIPGYVTACVTLCVAL